MTEKPTIEFDNAMEIAEAIRTVRQARLYVDEPVPEQIINQLLEIARWTGSARNTQPWQFIVVDDRDTLSKLSGLRKPINWLAKAPLGIAIVLNGENPEAEAFDEGRVTERLLTGARVLGLGGGIAWFGDEQQTAEGKRIFGVPAGLTSRSVVAIGYPASLKDTRPNANIGGRKPMSELLSHNRYGVPFADSHGK